MSGPIRPQNKTRPWLDKYRDRRWRAVVIVAHPDDESLFMGGTIAEMRRWRWTILCVTDCDTRYNKKRCSELEMVCRFYRKNGVAVDAEKLGIRKRKAAAKRPGIQKYRGFLRPAAVSAAVGRYLKEDGPFDIVFTHNRTGEYGHASHIAVHRAVRRLAAGSGRRSGVIGRLLYFAPFGKVDLSVRLAAASRRLKRQASSWPTSVMRSS